MEPWPDEPAVGAVCTPTTLWASPDSMDLPAEVCSDVPARVEAVTVDGRTEWVAHLGNGFTTMMGDGSVVGDVILHGCLVWDRYLWLDFKTRPQGSVRVLDRAGFLAQHEELSPTRHPGMFSVTPYGRMEYREHGSLPMNFGVQWNVLLVETVAPGS
ncbi:hypothetical protein QM797_01985 [Rhodococcus sp. IEGM 1381]|uniref:hypothetical protein n=1 Tax=Rhodococcus sp. IEGM 1381 TaxID=3047085 RepID=UPI0024B72166|nr:hypothetical protein [Rhodococcus sp. IEGM 1381]MDI9893482.1 hypothetical protein [Rhodococcus sp. IEGM 1381]